MGDEEEDLTEEIIGNGCLSKIGKIIDGTGFAYTQLDCVGRTPRVAGIAVLEKYLHLRSIDLSKNSIKDVAPLKALQHVLTLNLAQNQIASLEAWEEESLAYLRDLNLTDNCLKVVEPKLTQLKALKKVSLVRNEITSCEAFGAAGGHATLLELDLSQNKLEVLTGVGKLLELNTLNLSRNTINNLEGMEELPMLKNLDLSGNQLDGLAGPWSAAPNLNFLNLSGNLLAAAAPFEELRQLPKLRKLYANEDVAEQKNAVADQELYRLEMLICHWRLDDIDGVEVTEQDRIDAENLNNKRKEEAEAARKEAEEAEKGGDDA